MRVLHVQKVTGIGGSERHLLELLPALQSRGTEVHMVVAAAGGWERFVDAMRTRGISTTVVPTGPDIDPALVRRLMSEIRRLHPDLVHTHLIHADVHGQLAARISRVPAVSTVHSTNPLYRRVPNRMASTLAGRQARRTIAISHHVGRFIQALGLARPSHVRMIHYGIDAAGWRPDDRVRKNARRELGIANGETVVGVASRLFPFKGHDFLLRGMGRALAQGARAKLLIAGDGPLRSSIERQAGTLPDGSVELLGFVADIRSFMGACDLMAFPSLPGFGEGFGLAALESMAAARPVIATGIDSLPEIVVPEETGLLVEPEEDEQLAQALGRLAAEPELRRGLGERGRMRAREAFDLDRMVTATLDVYREAL